MDQDRKSAVSKLEILIKQNKGLDKDVKSNLTDLINALKDRVPRNTDMERVFKALENALKEKKPDVWKQINQIHNSLTMDSTGNVGAETSAAATEQKARAHGDTEMGFMEASFRAIIEILETNRDTEPFPKPDEREKETVGECYKYALKVADLCKARKSDLDHAYNIIGEIHNQVLEVDVVQTQEGSDQSTTIRKSEGTRPTVTKKTEHEMKGESEKKVRTASPSLQKKTDTTSSTKNGNKEKDQTVPTGTEPNRAQEIEMKRTAVSSALNKLKDTKGALERSSKIIQELYNQVMEVRDDREKTEPLMNTTPKKTANDTGQTTPQKIELDIGKELEMKATAVFTAFKKMKDTKGDLERVSKIIEDLHNQAKEINVDQAQEKQETPTTTGFKKGGVEVGHTVTKSIVPDMTPKLDKRANDVSSPSTKRTNTTSSYKKDTQETKQTVTTETEPDNGNELEMKAAAVSEALKKITDTKRNLERVSKIIEDLHNQAKEINVDQVQEKQGTPATTGFRKGGVEVGHTVPKSTVPDMTPKLDKRSNDASSPSTKRINTTSSYKKDTQETKQTVTTETEPDNGKELEMKAAAVSEALKKITDTKRLRNDLEIEKEQIRELKTRLKSIQDENTKLNKEADSLRTRLSEHAGALLYHENPAIADLSDQNRPTKLAEKYLELYDNQWTDAFSKLQTEYSSASDEELTGHLYNILVDGYVFCKDARQAQMCNLQEIMFDPTGDMSKSRRRPTEEMSKMFSNSLNDAAKLSSKVTSGNIAKAFVTNEKTKQKHGKMIEVCKTYIMECLQLCWYMQVQTPPLCLDLITAKGHAFEKNNYKEYTIRGKKITFVVWPALFLHKKGPLLSKGVAQGDSTGKQAAED